MLAAAAIAVVVALAAALIWWTSDARAASSRPAAQASTNPAAARDVPAALRQLWSAPSPATTAPTVVSGTVVTGAGPEVAGRDPATGEPRWSYARGVDLCAVSWIYRYAVAVYPDRRGCGQVSAVDAGTGRRGPARTSYADPRVTVSTDGSSVLSAGATRLELWRSDLVRVLSYGEIDARVKPSARGLGQGCTLVSAAAGSSAVSVLENCAGQAGLRLTLLRAGKDDDEPEQRSMAEPDVSADSGARVLAVADTGGAGINTAVYLPSPQPRIEVIDETGSVIAKTLLPAAATPASAGLPVSRSAGLISWWTGDSVLLLDATTLAYRYRVAASGSTVPLGPATSMAGRLLIPVSGGIGVYDLTSGERERIIPISRPLGAAGVVPAVSGTTVLEQRGEDLVALG